MKFITRPLVTIAIPTFNRAGWLQGCIDAALSQTYDKIEIIVSDNASTDDTPNLLRSIYDTRLQLIRQNSNIGATPNWNACLSRAKGIFIIFVSDDDRITATFVERCVKILELDPEIPMVVALAELVYAGSQCES